MLSFAKEEESDDGLQTYPNSRASVASSGIVVRTQTWCEHITQAWNVPITELESLDERVQRYTMYFTMTQQQMRVLLSKLLGEMRCGRGLHKADPNKVWDSSKCSLKMLDTCVKETHVPTGNEKGSVLALDFSGTEVAVARGVRVNLEGGSKITTTDVVVGLRDATLEYPKGLLDRKATASALFDCLAATVKKLMDEKGAPGRENEEIPMGFTLCFPVVQRALNSASLIHWTKGFETGRGSDDPVEGMDVAALLDCALWRAKLRAKTRAVLNDTTGALLTCAYESPPRMPPCKVGFVLGGGVNGCYMMSETKRSHGYIGSVINCELGGFDKSLPLNDVDLEVDFADESTRGKQLFEKMVSAVYLGELCRRLVVKIWQNEAPQLAWVRHSMPWLVCVRVMGDTKDPEMKDTAEILSGLWEWETTVLQRGLVQKLFQLVFDRSAALAAVAIVALASKTERLQPAMGGLTCAIGGALCRKSPYYFAKLRSSIDAILDSDLSRLIHLHQVEDCSAKGAALLAFKAGADGTVDTCHLGKH